MPAPRYTAGRPCRVRSGSLPLRRNPEHTAPLDSELLFGENVHLYDEDGDWAWVQNDRDDYVGYVERLGLAPLQENESSPNGESPTHRVSALRTFLYPEPDIKAPPVELISMNGLLRLRGETPDGFGVDPGGGWIFMAHTAVLDGPGATAIAGTALAFLGTPYLWGGRTSLGLDCSGLAQMALFACGYTKVPRDTDLQEAIGNEVDWQGDTDALQPGDLVYWRGHCAIRGNEDVLIHANATAMAVTADPVADALKWIADATGDDSPRLRRL